jgi:predicted RNA-binding protein with TRAM domain
MNIPEEIQCLFSATIETRDGTSVIEIPDREMELGELEPGTVYRVALLQSTDSDRPSSASQDREQRSERQTPPVEEGETRRVEIEDIGDQGDGVTRVDRGFVIIVPDTEQGQRVEIEIDDVRQNVAFGTVTERLSYYE